MKKATIYLIACAMMAIVSSCAMSSRSSSAGGEVTGVSATSWAEPTPYGMVLVSRGSM